jgi:hypothetical protein
MLRGPSLDPTIHGEDGESNPEEEVEREKRRCRVVNSGGGGEICPFWAAGTTVVLARRARRGKDGGEARNIGGRG